jgi:hypothetical protein
MFNNNNNNNNSSSNNNNNKVCAHLHYSICKALGIEMTKKWYIHMPKPLYEQEDFTVL